MEPNNIKRLIENSKELREGTREKEKYSAMLDDLRFFEKFCQIFDGDEGLVKYFFKVTHKVVPVPGGESLLLSIQNVTTEFTFNSAHWTFSLQQDIDSTSTSARRSASTLTLEKSLGPGKVENISVPLPLEPFYKIHFKLNLVFSFDFEDRYFQRLFPCGEIVVDVLQMLDPGRRIDSPPRPLTSYTALLVDEGQQPKRAPPSVKTEFKINDRLRQNFLKLFLSESLHRGFRAEILAEPIASPYEMVTFFGNDEVLLQIGPERVAIRTFSSPLLFALKEALMKRLETLEGLELKCPSDSHLEELFDLKLSLSAGNCDSADSKLELNESYLRLRKVTDDIEYHLGDEDNVS